MFGRRPDGRRIEDMDPIMRITPYVMPMRCDAQVMLRDRIDMDAVSGYIRRQKLENNESFSHMIIMIASYVRAISHNPEVNRFIMNKELYARNNCSVAFTILKDPHDIDKGEAVVKIKFDPSDTIYDVRDRVNAGIEANRGDEPAGFTYKFLSGIFAVPGLVTVLTGIIGFLDRYGLAPGVLIDGLPFYVSVYITDTASIGLHDVNHHIYNWGDVSAFISMGLTERIAVVENGNTRMKRFLPLGLTIDERSCSGAHYARFYAEMKRCMEHPEILEVPPENVRYDKECVYHEPKPCKEQKNEDQ